MKKIKFRSLLLAPLVAVLMLFVVSPGHMASASMPGMEKASENSVQCQAACPVLPADDMNKEIVFGKDTDPDPNPALPYYSGLINLAYFAPILLSAYLLNLARKWRPPDLVVQYSNYRF